MHLHKDLFKASDNKTEFFLLYLEDFLDFIVVVVVVVVVVVFFWGGVKATHLPVVAYSVLQYLLSLYYF